jgi:hypothetical protein
MKRFWDKNDGGGIGARLHNQRPEPPQALIDRVIGEIDAAPKARAVSRSRRVAAVVFASMALTSVFGAAAFATQGGNGGGSNGNGNGDSGTPAGCVEGNGNASSQNPNC